ncbi:uncharacterized protein [Porites lutea]|uniref:uncharacterized protein n=1 Tax=Porites lutea TaxID=51062 RepID=UPI003CC57696
MQERSPTTLFGNRHQTVAIELESARGFSDLLTQEEEQTGITRQGGQHHFLKAYAVEFIPRFQATGGRFESAERFGKLDRGITGGRHSLNVFAKEFVPVDFQNRASASGIFPLCTMLPLFLLHPCHNL